MSPRPAPLKQSDLTRYAKAMQAAGVDDWRLEIEPTGRVVIVAGKGAGDDRANPCDRLLK